jgi:hypothetical protein
MGHRQVSIGQADELGDLVNLHHNASDPSKNWTEVLEDALRFDGASAIQSRLHRTFFPG